MKTSIYEYNGCAISFNKEKDSTMVNATEMAKPFGKRTTNWLTTNQAQELISTLSAKTGIPVTGLVLVNQGGSNSGTWMHEDVALMFAQWLSPEFYFWCNDRIKELAKYGITATQPAIDTILSDPDNAIKILTALKEERAAKERLEVQTVIQQKEIEKAAPKVEYFDRVMQSSTVYTTTQVAKEFGMGAKSFNKLLREKKLVFQQNGQWLLYAPHDRQGYTKTRTYNFFREDGTPGTSTQTVWTEKGREWLHRIMKDKNAHGVYVSLPHARVATIATQM